VIESLVLRRGGVPSRPGCNLVKISFSLSIPRCCDTAKFLRTAVEMSPQRTASIPTSSQQLSPSLSRSIPLSPTATDRRHFYQDGLGH
jgi:hypothetical protein